jgi:hypothetical protein
MSIIETRRIGVDDVHLFALLGVHGDITTKARRVWQLLHRRTPELIPADVAFALRHVQPHVEAFNELLAQRIERIKPKPPRRCRHAP